MVCADTSAILAPVTVVLLRKGMFARPDKFCTKSAAPSEPIVPCGNGKLLSSNTRSNDLEEAA